MGLNKIINKMKAYNIYYNNEKINNRPISRDDMLNNILKQKYIFKHNGQNLIKIDLDKTKIIETILV